MLTEKNAQPKSWELCFIRPTCWGLKPRSSLSDSSEGLLWRGKGEARICRSFATKTWYSKRLLLIKENQTSQVNEFSAFLCTGRCKILGSLKSFLWYAPQLSKASISLFPSQVPLGLSVGGWGWAGAAVNDWWLDGHNIFCLLIWQTAFLFHRPQGLESRRKMYPQTPGSAREAVSNKRLNHGYCNSLLTSPRTFGGSPLVLVWATKCCPKTNRMPDISLAKMELFRISWDCNLGSGTMVKHVQVPAQQGKEKDFLEGKRKMGRAVNKEPKAFHWLSRCLERRAVFLPFGLCYCCRVWELPLLVSGLYLIGGFVY